MTVFTLCLITAVVAFLAGAVVAAVYYDGKASEEKILHTKNALSTLVAIRKILNLPIDEGNPALSKAQLDQLTEALCAATVMYYDLVGVTGITGETTNAVAKQRKTRGKPIHLLKQDSPPHDYSAGSKPIDMSKDKVRMLHLVRDIDPNS